MKLLILLSLVALCYSQFTFIGRHITVDEDGTITVLGVRGREIEIRKSTSNPRSIKITLRSEDEPTRTLQVDEASNIHNVHYSTVNPKFYTALQSSGRLPDDFTQHDILVHVFREHEGLINEIKYESLLEKIRRLVNYGVLKESIHDILRNFDKHYNTLKQQQLRTENEKNESLEDEFGLTYQNRPSDLKHMTLLERLHAFLQQRDSQQRDSQQRDRQQRDRQEQDKQQRDRQQHDRQQRGLFEEIFPEQDLDQEQQDPEYLNDEQIQQFGQHRMNPWMKYHNMIQQRRANQQGFLPQFHHQYQQQFYPDQFLHEQQFPGYFGTGQELHQQFQFQQPSEQIKMTPWTRFLFNMNQQRLARIKELNTPQWQQQEYYPHQVNQLEQFYHQYGIH